MHEEGHEESVKREDPAETQQGCVLTNSEVDQIPKPPEHLPLRRIRMQHPASNTPPLHFPFGTAMTLHQPRAHTLSILTCPGWKQSNAPSMYTMRAPSGATRPLENCTRRRLVGRNLGKDRKRR